MLKRDLAPRLYQQTIFNTAASKNTLVVLPTGMGKTLIAELLAVHRLQSYPGSKVLFLAPTKPLVQQHLDTFTKDLDLKEDELVLFTGNVAPSKRAALWKKAKIVFSTPQGLENDILGGKADLADVSLLIFDEAHRATGDYSYVFVAERYKKRARHERILALTASPGSDKETIEDVCRNLYIEEIEVRSSESSDVQPYIQDIEIEHVKVQMPEEFKTVHTALLRCYEQRVEDIQAIGYVHKNALSNKTTMLKAQAALHAEAARGSRSFESLKSMSLLAESLKVQHAIELIETQGVAALQKYFDKLEGEARSGQSKAVQNIVKDVNFKAAQLHVARLVEREIEHPKLRAVKKAVLKEVYANKDAKIIIFNQYRDQAVKIKEAVDSIGISSKIFVGQMKKGETGMSQKVQHAILEEFRSGGFNCLIATSVAEEGLDIPKVDVVIFYEPIPSAIRTVQRRGRTGRLEKGKVIMLVTEGTRDVAYKYAAKNKEKRMYRVLDDVQRDFRARNGEALSKGRLDLQSYETNEGRTNEKEESGRSEPSTAPQSVVRIVADHREKASGVLKALLDHPIELELKQLEIGDYLLSDRVVVEYKTVQDFVDSIIDGRLLQQLRNLRSYPRPLIIIEGEEDIYSVRKMHPNAILGMLATIMVSYNIPVLFTKTSRETAALLAVIAKRESEHGRGDAQLHTAKPLTESELQEFIVASLPGVGPGLAKSLLAEFGTIQKVVNASEDQLSKVEKIGPKKAKAIHEILRKTYEPGK